MELYAKILYIIFDEVSCIKKSTNVAKRAIMLLP